MYKPIVGSKIDRYKKEYYFDLIYLNSPENAQHIFWGKDLQFQSVLKKVKKPDQHIGRPMFEMKLTLCSHLIQIKELVACNLANLSEARKELFFSLFIYSLKEHVVKKYNRAGIIVSSYDPFIQDALVDNNFRIKTTYNKEDVPIFSGMWRRQEEEYNIIEDTQ